MKWTGYLQRDLSGEITFGDEKLVLRGERQDDGTIAIRAAAPNAHWSGTISADRTAWSMSCPFGFELSGTVVFEGGRLVLTQTRFRCPPELLLPDEVEVRECVG